MSLLGSRKRWRMLLGAVVAVAAASAVYISTVSTTQDVRVVTLPQLPRVLYPNLVTQGQSHNLGLALGKSPTNIDSTLLVACSGSGSLSVQVGDKALAVLETPCTKPQFTGMAIAGNLRNQTIYILNPQKVQFEYQLYTGDGTNR